MGRILNGEDPASILIVKLSAIGDVVHALAFLQVLRGRFPRARIDWLVEEAAQPLIEGHPAIDKVLLCRRKSWERTLKHRPGSLGPLREVWVFLRELRSFEYDLVVDLQGLLKSGVLVGLSRGKRKIGMTGSREGAGLFLNERAIPVNYEEHAVDRYLRVAEYLGCRTDLWDGRIPFTEAERRSVDMMLARAGVGEEPLVAINPVARWQTKLWDPERFADLAGRMRKELGCRVVFTGGATDRPVIHDICRMMEGFPLNLAGRTTLKELACLYTRCRLLITTDTGPMHMAVAMGRPVVALFGPTAPWRTGPYGKGHRVIRSGVECSPCFKKRCSHMTCMKEIGVGDVFNGIREIVEETTKSERSEEWP